MAISSLESLLTKYGANFGLSAQTIADFKAAQSGAKKGTDTTPAAGEKTAATDQGNQAGSGSKADKVELSQAALDYQKAHSLPSGKFMPPNLIGDMLDAFDNADGASNSDTPTLADLMGASDAAAGDTGVNGKPATSDPSNYFDSLGKFLT